MNKAQTCTLESKRKQFGIQQIFVRFGFIVCASISIFIAMGCQNTNYDLQNNQNKQFEPNFSRNLKQTNKLSYNAQLVRFTCEQFIKPHQFINSKLEDQIENLKPQTITQNQNIENLQNNQQQLSSNINSIDIKIPKTIFYDPYYSKDVWWDLVPVLNQMHTHPSTFAKIQIDRKSMVKLRLQRHMLSGNQHIYVFFMKDKKPIPPKIFGNDNKYWDSYLYKKFFEFDVLRLIFDIVVEPGTYLFDFGVICYLQFAFPEGIKAFLAGWFNCQSLRVIFVIKTNRKIFIIIYKQSFKLVIFIAR